MTRQVRITADIVANQRRASDPGRSVWVRANAGSGKTHVLTERVMRLLLGGARPEEILCLTYTKAAAAEMRRRVAEKLAGWAVMPEAELGATLAELEGGPPDTATRLRARTLFAHALETPGGLKINTIHAFCESVLHRFPLEAGVPFDFAVIEEAEAEQMIAAARDAVLAEGLRGGALGAAVETLFEQMSDFAIGEAIRAALANVRSLRDVLVDAAQSKRRLRTLVGVGARETLAERRAAFAGDCGLDADDCRQVVTLLGEANAFGRAMAAIDLAAPTPEALMAAFLTEKGEPRKQLLRAAESKRFPELQARLEAVRDRIGKAAARLKAMALVARSEAVLDLVVEITDRYAQQKRARSLLDFDDLVEKLIGLFENSTVADWVRYKLDAGITHILVDESQDTNPEQWRVVKAMADEFFAGESAAQRRRTLFAVGDEKQSIYSFQGADPVLFGESGRRYGRMAAEAGEAFADVPLHTSFRTLPGILQAVDRIFALPQLQAAVLANDEAVVHSTARGESGGSVTLWPPIGDETDEVDPSQWLLAPPPEVKSPQRRLAERIAAEIAGWLQAGRPLGPRRRPVRPEDILILVQTRGGLFTELIRALGHAGVPTPGADRLQVTGHIAVLDLLALGDVLALPADDLQLAALLRSPLFEVSEGDLYGLAHGRAGTLWQALEASSLPAAQSAWSRLRNWRDRLDSGRPYEFYAEVLYRQGGLKRLHGRLGPEVDDVVAEFLELALAHEQSAAPSLLGFLAEMRAREVEIRRELAEAGGGVRVMTIHGAKGLEAPIVILADAASRGGDNKSPPVLLLRDAPGPLLVHAGSGADHTAETLPHRDAARQKEADEYWRKLYVGMTRAEDELYVTGYLTSRSKPEESWYGRIEAALAEDVLAVANAAGDTEALVFPRPGPAVATTPEAATAATGIPLTPLALPPLPRPQVIARISPSTAGAAEPAERLLDSAAEASRDAEGARKAGLALHALLQHLPQVAATEREQVGQAALRQLLPEAPQSHAALTGKAMRIIADPAFVDIFGPDSRAEVPFGFDAVRQGKPVRLSGRIDRLVVAKGHIMVVDYKSDASPPGDASQVPASYRTQVGLYAHVASQLFPGQVVKAGILWTSLESLMILPDAVLRDAVSAFTMR